MKGWQKALNVSAALFRDWRWKKLNKFYRQGWETSWNAVLLKDVLRTSQKLQWGFCRTLQESLCGICVCVRVVRACLPWCKRPGGAWQSTACYPEPACLEESGWNPQLDSHGSEKNRGAVWDMFLNTFHQISFLTFNLFDIID